MSGEREEVSAGDVDVNRILSECVPQWHQADFLFAEPHPWWAPSVQAILAQPKAEERGSVRGGADAATIECRCESVKGTRAVFDLVRMRQVTGVVLFARDQVRDCLLLLGRLSRLCRSCPPVLVVIPSEAVSLMPVLLESGATAVMREGVSDLQIADWCRRVARAAAIAERQPGDWKTS